ncbi:unnamed protein product [Rhizoctonia solani]|uniref:Transmembrane protein n=1 Tax=Rhizoctonia solani TaxID=456999 RepID=A0A8H2WRB1_9AGAM|nr:unnamed protein product [Rhizoctonia solani]
MSHSATSIGLITTIVNGFVLYALGGEEIIWVCFGACAADVVINAAVMYWAMQSPPGPKGTVHFSPLSLTDGTPAQPPNDTSEGSAACRTRHKTVTPSFPMPGREEPQEGTLSNGTTVGSIVSAPMIDMPQPTMRNTHHVDLYGNHPPGSRLLLSLSTKRAPKSEESEEADISLQEMGLVQNRPNGSAIYGVKSGQTSSKGN